MKIDLKFSEKESYPYILCGNKLKSKATIN